MSDNPAPRYGIDPNFTEAAPTPVASRDQLARVLDPDIFDESKPRSKRQAAVIQIAARQHMAYQGADRLLAAGVFREPPTLGEVAQALAECDAQQQIDEWPERYRIRQATAVLALLNGTGAGKCVCLEDETGTEVSALCTEHGRADR